MYIYKTLIHRLQRTTMSQRFSLILPFEQNTCDYYIRATCNFYTGGRNKCEIDPHSRVQRHRNPARLSMWLWVSKSSSNTSDIEVIELIPIKLLLRETHGLGASITSLNLNKTSSKAVDYRHVGAKSYDPFVSNCQQLPSLLH